MGIYVYDAGRFRRSFFASFPLFYSTSFGGAYWLWMAILFSFIIQAVSYEYRSKKGNFLGQNVYDVFLLINGIVGVVLIGVAVGTFFTGADFRVDKANLYDDLSMPIISTWQNPWHGLEAVLDWRNLLLGITLFFWLACRRCFILSTISIAKRFMHGHVVSCFTMRFRSLYFSSFVVATLCADGYQFNSVSGEISVRAYKYFYNLMEMPWVLFLFLLGVAGVLYAIVRSVFFKRWIYGIWFSGIGTIFVVLSLFFLAGYNNTPYYPSAVDMQSSLTIYNSSSSLFTLEVMSVVSLVLPVVAGYIFLRGGQWIEKQLRPMK